MKTYHVTNPATFKLLLLSTPPNYAVFWSQGSAGGVLLLPGVHYEAGAGWIQIDNAALNAGDTITILTL